MTETLDFRDPEWVADKLGIDKNAVYRYLNEGTLPGLQLGRKWLISESTLVQFLQAEADRQTAERRRAAGGRHDRFTDAAHVALTRAQEFARERGHNWVGTEHLLLVLATSGEPAARMLLACDSSPEAVASAVEEVMVGFAEAGATLASAIGITPRMQKALEHAVKEAEASNSYRAGPEHLLVGMMALGNGIAFDVCSKLGVSVDCLRGQLGPA